MGTRYILPMVILTLVLFNACSKYNPDNASEARTMSEEFVKDKLQFPKTAEFASSSEAKVVKIDGIWRVNSYVLEDNVFGGKTRRSYRCLMTLDSLNEKWHLESLEFKQ